MTREEIKEKIIASVKKHRAIVKDIYIPKGDITSNNSETKKDLQKFFDSQKAIEDFHKKKIEEFERLIKEAKIKNEEAKKAKAKKEEERNMKNKKDKKPPKTPAKTSAKAPKKVEASKAKEEPKKEELKKEDCKKEDSKEKDSKEEDSKEEEEEEEKIVEIEEDSKEPEKPKEIKWEKYDHQGAAIVLLDEFDLGILLEEDLVIEEEEVEEVKEEPEPAAELAFYNCIACTLENPMTNATCSICGTARPPMEESNNNGGDDNAKGDDKDDITKAVEDKYDLAIKNRTEFIIKDIKEIVEDYKKVDEELENQRKEELKLFEKKLSMMNILTKEKCKEAKLSLKKVESMGLGNLFGEAEEDSEKKAEPKKEEGKQEEKVKEEGKEDKKEEEKKEDKREEEKKEEKQEEKKPEKEPREDIKIFFGNTVEDDYKSEVFLAIYLKHLLLNEDKQLTEP